MRDHLKDQPAEFVKVIAGCSLLPVLVVEFVKMIAFQIRISR